jgi:hypothetical protein
VGVRCDTAPAVLLETKVVDYAKEGLEEEEGEYHDADDRVVVVELDNCQWFIPP